MVLIRNVQRNRLPSLFFHPGRRIRIANQRAERRGERAWMEKQTMADHVQHVIVMRHGDRLDNSEAEPFWIATAARPWDPPLTDPGMVRAWSTGKKLLRLDFRISRVFVSPFLRCIQTASEALAALGAVDDVSHQETSANTVVDPSKIKVSIEYGLCEIFNTIAIRSTVAPKDGNFTFELPQLEAKLAGGTIDHTVERVFKELPKWQEGTEEARSRYEKVIIALADKFPHENLLIVSHGEAVGVAISAFLKNATVYEVDYCAYAHLRRRITSSPGEKLTAENFKVATGNGLTGICWQEGEL